MEPGEVTKTRGEHRARKKDIRNGQASLMSYVP